MSRVRAVNSIFTIDCVVFGFMDDQLHVLLIERGEDPYNDCKAIPGDFVRVDEELDESANRVLSELTGLKEVYFKQFKSYAGLDRHPWGRILTVGYYAIIHPDREGHNLSPSSFAKHAEWHPISNLPELAFDHQQIVDGALASLRSSVRTKPVGFELLPDKFTIRELQVLYEGILDRKLDKRNFRRKMLKLGLIMPLDEKQQNVAHKAARFFSFDEKRYRELQEKGYNIELA